MSQQQREKFTATTTPEKPCQDKPFIQVEGELTQEQLEAIAAGVNSFSQFLNHNMGL